MIWFADGKTVEENLQRKGGKITKWQVFQHKST